MSSPLPSYHHHHGHQDHCARIHLRVDWLRDLSSSTLTVSAQSEHGRDRRCIFTKPHQKECILDNIDVGVNNDGKLHIHCRLHNAPTYNIGTENNQAAKHLPDVTKPHHFTIDAGELVAEASLEFNVNQVNWDPPPPPPIVVIAPNTVFSPFPP
jgi:hypothetical protein